MKGVIEQEFWKHRMHALRFGLFWRRSQAIADGMCTEFGLYQEIAEVFTIGHFGDWLSRYLGCLAAVNFCLTQPTKSVVCISCSFTTESFFLYYPFTSSYYCSLS